MKNIVIFGTSGHAKVIVDILERSSQYSIVGFIDDFKEKNTSFLGYEILGKTEDIPDLIVKTNLKGGIIAIGDNWVRKNVRDKIISLAPSFIFINAIHPEAQIAKNVQLGKGIAIMAGAIINSNSIIDDHCIVNTNSSLDHDSIMEEFSSLAPGVTTGGNVRIGKFSAISLGANIIQGINIGEHVVVGAGSLVLENIADSVVAYGTPSKIIRDRKKGEKYL